MPKTTRRRLLTIMGAAAGMTLAPDAGSTSVPRWHWHGMALGAKAEIVLVHPDEATAKNLIRLAVDEIERLEDVFSLYRSKSEISRLNRDGLLDTPSPDLVSLLSSARSISELTKGAFDVTVQPIWRLYADHFSNPDANPGGPTEAAIERTRHLVDYRALDIASSKIRIGRADMAITLNGIAQGYITDRVADLLRAHGVEQTLIDLGEIRTLGSRPDGRPWQIAIDGDEQKTPIDLTDQAIATSNPKGTIFDQTGRYHHLFDPASGQPSRQAGQLSVIAKRAAFADALSTGLATMSDEAQVAFQRSMPNVAVYPTSRGLSSSPNASIIEKADAEVNRSDVS